MNRKFEDRLVDLAFGDVGPEDARRIEQMAEADPAAARQLQEYKSMRADLKSLNDIPQDQMSKERLRDAILGQGLRPAAAKTSTLGWLWMPATAFVLAAGLLFIKNPTHPEPVVAISNQHAATDRVALNVPTDMSDLKYDVMGGPSFSNWTDPVRAASQAPAVAKSSQPSAARKSSFRVVRHDATVGAPQSMPLTSAPKITPTALDTQSSPAPVQPLPNEPAADVSTQNPAPIVIIEDNRDSQTGANRATEVGASNVLIGG